MPLSDTIAALTQALDAAKAELAAVDDSISGVEGEIYRVEQMPPHTDDIIASCVSGVRMEVDEFKRQLKGRLSDAFGGEGAAARSRAPLRLLTLEPTTPTSEEQLTRSMSKALPVLNMGALVYFLGTERNGWPR